MITFICTMCILMGAFFEVYDLFMPLNEVLPIALYLTIRFVAIILIFAGCGVLVFRIYQTTVNNIIDPDAPNQVTLLHGREGGRYRFFKGYLQKLNTIIAGTRRYRMLFVDTGASIRFGGHDLRITQEAVCHDIPWWLSEYFSKIREKYSVKDFTEYKKLYNELKNLQSKEKLNSIKLLQPLLKDSEKELELKSMTLEELRNLSEILVNGRTVDIDTIKRFNDRTNPHALYDLVKSEVSQRIAEHKSLTPMMQTDMIKWAIVITILFIGGALAFQMIQ